MKKPRIVCLCGSTRFKKEYERIQWELTKRGVIVLSVGCYMHADKVKVTTEEKQKVDELHLHKIDLADEVIVVCPGTYIGESTNSEIQYARGKGKTVRYSLDGTVEGLIK